MSTEHDEKLPSEWRFWWRLLLSLLAIVLLVMLVYAEENWRGKRAWERYRREWEAKGERFDLKSVIPPAVPDDQNFAMAPLLAPLFDFNPRPLQPGQGLYRNTNAVARIQNLASDVKWTNTSVTWMRGQSLSLPAWAMAFSLKSNAQARAASPPARAEAAAELLQSLERYRPVLDEIQAASRRPYSRFNLRYGDEVPSGILLPHLNPLRRVASLLELRASAELALNRNDEALANVELTMYLADAVKGEPMLISGLTRISLLQTALQPVWEGLAGHQWSDAQLVELQQRLEKTDLLAEYAALIRGERAMSLASIDFLRRQGGMDQSGPFGPGSPNYRNEPIYRLSYLMPSGWFYRNQVTLGRMYQDLLLPAVDAANHRSFPDRELGGAAIQQQVGRGSAAFSAFAALLVPATAKAAMKFASTQTSVDEAAIACALERYRLANGQFPETLDALTPQFIKSIPHDIITGEPLKYRRTDDGRFVLYSVGWNRLDDGGANFVGGGPNGVVDPERGDWAWPQYPPK